MLVRHGQGVSSARGLELTEALARNLASVTGVAVSLGGSHQPQEGENELWECGIEWVLLHL